MARLEMDCNKKNLGNLFPCVVVNRENFISHTWRSRSIFWSTRNYKIEYRVYTETLLDVKLHSSTGVGGAHGQTPSLRRLCFFKKHAPAFTRDGVWIYYLLQRSKQLCSESLKIIPFSFFQSSE